jgi:hypothetical protein
MMWHPKLLAYWGLENAQTHIGVLTGQNLTLTGAQYADGKLGRGLTFDGVDDYATASTGWAAYTGSAKKFSICAWIKPAAGGGDNDGIIALAGSFGTDVWAIRVVSTQLDFTYIRLSGTYPYNIQRANDAWGFGEWQHLCVTNNGGGDGAKGVRIYRNASEVAVTNLDTSGGLTFQALTDSALVIGRYNNSNANCWPGEIDELSVWSDVLGGRDIGRVMLGMPPLEV